MVILILAVYEETFDIRKWVEKFIYWLWRSDAEAMKSFMHLLLLLLLITALFIFLGKLASDCSKKTLEVTSHDFYWKWTKYGDIKYLQKKRCKGYSYWHGYYIWHWLSRFINGAKVGSWMLKKRGEFWILSKVWMPCNCYYRENIDCVRHIVMNDGRLIINQINNTISICPWEYSAQWY